MSDPYRKQAPKPLTNEELTDAFRSLQADFVKLGDLTLNTARRVEDAQRLALDARDEAGYGRRARKADWVVITASVGLGLATLWVMQILRAFQ